MNDDEKLALGSYVDAESRATSAIYQREKLLMNLERQITGVHHAGINAGYAKQFNVNAAREIIDNVAKLEETIRDAVTEMNASAQKAGRQQIRIGY